MFGVRQIRYIKYYKNIKYFHLCRIHLQCSAFMLCVQCIEYEYESHQVFKFYILSVL